MNLQKHFEIAAATTIGRNHIKFRKNNQDAFAVHMSDDIVIGIVADGCGSQPYSEVGAQQGVLLLKNAILQRIWRGGITQLSKDPELFLNQIQSEIESKLLMFSDYDDSILIRYYAFTLLGVIITKEKTYVFSFGDGNYAINKEAIAIGPYPNNMPPYIVYGVIAPHRIKNIDQTLLHFELQQVVDTVDVQQLFIGSDGLEDLDVDTLWEEDIIFKNPYALQKKLFLINKSVYKIDWKNHKKSIEHGKLIDDTTLVMIRRKKED